MSPLPPQHWILANWSRAEQHVDHQNGGTRLPRSQQECAYVAT